MNCTSSPLEMSNAAASGADAQRDRAGELRGADLELAEEGGAEVLRRGAFHLAAVLQLLGAQGFRSAACVRLGERRALTFR